MAEPRIIDYPKKRDLLRAQLQKIADDPAFDSSVASAKSFLAGRAKPPKAKNALTSHKKRASFRAKKA